MMKVNPNYKVKKEMKFEGWSPKTQLNAFILDNMLT